MPTVNHLPPPSDPNMLNAADYLAEYDDLDDLYMQVTDDDGADNDDYWNQYDDELPIVARESALRQAPRRKTQNDYDENHNPTTTTINASDLYWDKYVDHSANLLSDQPRQSQRSRGSRRSGIGNALTNRVSNHRNPSNLVTTNDNANTLKEQLSVKHCVFYHHHYLAGEDIVLPPHTSKKGEHFHHVHFDGPMNAVPRTMRDKATVRTLTTERPQI